MLSRKMTVVVLGMIFVAVSLASGSAPKYVFLFVGSGMGPEQVKAAAIYAGGAEGSLNFEKFPYKEVVTVKWAGAGAADEAAAATGLATGIEVNKGVVSMRIPGAVKDKEPETILEYSRDTLKKSTGLVTDSFLTDAVPAALGAHEPKSTNYPQIADDYLRRARANVLLGGGGFGMSKDAAEKAGYTVVTDKAGLAGLDYKTTFGACGLFGEGPMGYAGQRKSELPSLAEMTAGAIKVLEKNRDGFFLMVNASNIAQACRENDIAGSIAEVMELQKAVQVAIDWAKDTDETLILVTGDVEVGGLTVTTNNGHGKLPGVTWAGKETTEAKVPVYGRGQNSQMVAKAPSNQVLCVIASYDPNLPVPRSRWKTAAIIGSLAIMAIMMILSRGGRKAAEI
jgi:alkaline phosphatase